MSSTNAPRTARAIARAELTLAILTSATSQLGEVGPAALSVRAVARDLGMASSAVYRYFPSRDALLTALLIQSYDDLGQAVEDADASVTDRTAFAQRLRVTAAALRDWSRAHPHEYALLYGSPVPGYAAPDDTVVSGTRVTFSLLALVADAQAAGRRTSAPVVAVSEAERTGLAPVLGFTDPGLEPSYAVRATMAWATLFGHLSLELFGHLHRGVLDYDAHWAQVVAQLAADLGLEP